MTLLDFVRAFFALIAVLSLIGIGALVAQRLGLGAAPSTAKRKRRLQLMDVLALDQKRKAAILRCDGVDHLIVMNASGVTVIDRGINQRAAAGRITAGAQRPDRDRHVDSGHGTCLADGDGHDFPANTPENTGTDAATSGALVAALTDPATRHGAKPRGSVPHGNPRGVAAMLTRLTSAAPGIATRLKAQRPGNDDSTNANSHPASRESLV